MKNKILIFLCIALSVLLIFSQIEGNQMKEIHNKTIKQNKENLEYLNRENKIKINYLKGKNEVLLFLFKKEPLSTIDVFFRSNEEFNVFNFENMEISNFTIQPIFLEDQISKVYLDEDFFESALQSPINIASKIKFSKNHFSKNYTNNYNSESDCGAEASFKVAFILTLSYNFDSELLIKESESKDYLMGFDKCGYDLNGYDLNGYGEYIR